MKHRAAPPAIHVHCIITSGYTERETARDLALLDEEERATFQRFGFCTDSRDYAAAHALLRSMLSELMPDVAPIEWRFDRDNHGKPHLANPLARSVHFSLSHTRGLVACVTSPDEEVGIDLECDHSCERNIDPLVTEICSEEEQAQLSELAGGGHNSLFLDIWTLKEAYAKACGLGFAVDLDSISFDLRQPASISARLPGQNSDWWRFALMRPTSTSRMALAMRLQSATSPDVVVLDRPSRRLVEPLRTTAVRARREESALIAFLPSLTCCSHVPRWEKKGDAHGIARCSHYPSRRKFTESP